MMIYKVFIRYLGVKREGRSGWVFHEAATARNPDVKRVE